MANVRDFGAVGDGKADDTAAIRHALDQGGGSIEFPAGRYLLRETVTVDLTKTGYVGMQGSGGTAQVIMQGPGPAFRIVGSHQGTASPSTVKPAVWQNERFVNVSQIEIVGAHAQADGIELVRTMQTTISQTLIRNVRHAVHLVERNRNFVLSGCHIYDNSGVGVFFDRCNLHQVILSANHISYNKHAGIKSTGGDLHNLQITGNDIEYNYHPQIPGSADIWFETLDGIASEITISSNTIQSVLPAGGANVRIVGQQSTPPNHVRLVAINGNVLGSQAVNIELAHVNRVAISGNTIYGGKEISITARDAHQMSITGNAFGWRYRDEEQVTGGIRLEDCSACTLSGVVLERSLLGDNDAGGCITLVRTTDSSVYGCQILDPKVRGIWLAACRRCRVVDNSIVDRNEQTTMLAAIESVGAPASRSDRNVIGNNMVTNGLRGAVVADEQRDQLTGNIVL